MSVEATTMRTWADLVAMWRRESDLAAELRKRARNVRRAYRHPEITPYTHPYADDLERAADIIQQRQRERSGS